jgi:hypothetical protein
VKGVIAQAANPARKLPPDIALVYVPNETLLQPLLCCVPFTFERSECIVIYIMPRPSSENQVCNFKEMLTNPAFEPHFSRSFWEHQAAVRPEVAFLSCLESPGQGRKAGT